MYGSNLSDLVVKYYDDAFGITGEAEREWYLNIAKDYGGPVLDLACGTGRLALLLAQEGFEVTGIDSSEGMLHLFREKLSLQPGEIRKRIRIENQTMSSFKLGQKFNTIFCCDAFFHNLTVQDQQDCLAHIRRHLAPEGRFVFNLHNPSEEFILSCLESKGEKFNERGRYPIANSSETLRVEQAHAIDESQQTVTTHLRLSRLDRHDQVLEKGESTWASRSLYPDEAVQLLNSCGFEVESLVGDYHNGPVAKNSQLIFQAKPARLD